MRLGWNLVCSVLEQVVMCVCRIYLFMSANAQTDPPEKNLVFFWISTALGASVYGAAFLTRLTRECGSVYRSS